MNYFHLAIAFLYLYCIFVLLFTTTKKIMQKAIQTTGAMDYTQQVEFTHKQIGVGTMPLQDDAMYCTIYADNTWDVGVYSGRVVATGCLETISTRSYIGCGFSAGQIIVEAENRSSAWEQIQQIEWNCACSCGNHPDPGKEEDVVEIPRFINVYAIRNNNDGYPSYTYRRKTATGWEYFTSPEIAYAWLFSQGMHGNMIQLHLLAVKLEA